MTTYTENIGKPERDSQNRIIDLFKNELGYTYLGDWEEEPRISPVEEEILKEQLVTRGYSEEISSKAVDKFMRSVNTLAEGLYQANKNVYALLRYGVEIKEDAGSNKETVHLIDWKNPENNHFGLAEEVSFMGKHPKRPDLVLYVNGIGLGVIELKRSKTGLEEGIRQNIDNQQDKFIPRFFTTMQLLMAGNDTQGLKYGTVGTSEKYYLKWKEDSDKEYKYLIDKQLSLLCNKKRLLEFIYDYTIFHKGAKKLARPNQFFGIQAAQQNVRAKKGGIIWHTQGSGKSLTMVWLTKWIIENINDSRVLIITDREELDDQIEKLFTAVDESIHRTKNGRDLISTLNSKEENLVCSLVHKFGRFAEEGDYGSFIQDIQSVVGSDFKAKGNIFVFVDECHRTQSGKLHDAMKAIIPEGLFIGFTGTPLLKKDKQKSIEIFGPYIGDPYKFDEAVEDEVVLDLLYEARDVAQFVSDKKSVDQWFESETRGLTDTAKTELKRKWGTMQKVLGSKARLNKIVIDIVKDFNTQPRLKTGEGNAMLVSGSIYQACKYYELFQSVNFKKCAIITSYEPHHGDIKGEETGEENVTDKLLKYEVYQQMLNGKTTEQFEDDVKWKFINEPAQMKLLIVVDKLLTGFDAPSASYLYIDKSMQDHGLFQAICRVNRVDDDSKKYGYIIDYKDLFKSLNKSIKDYTSAAFDDFDIDDVSGLLKDRFEASKERLENALEAVKAICEPVHPKTEPAFIKFFCGNTEMPEDLKKTIPKRKSLYKAVVSLIRAFTDIANELHKLGYSSARIEQIKKDVKFYSDLRDTIKKASGDFVDLKKFEPGMRLLMDMYLDAKSSKVISDFKNKSLVQLIVKVSEPSEEYKKKNQESVAETIENNVRKTIVEKNQTNPVFFNKMSKLLKEIIKQRKKEVISYKEYLKKIKELAGRIDENNSGQGSLNDYPDIVDSKAKKALYDNLKEDQVLVLALDNVIQTNKLDNWRDGGIKQKKLKLAVKQLLGDTYDIDQIMTIIKAQKEY